MDRVNELRGAAGGLAGGGGEADASAGAEYLTADSSSKYFSLSESECSAEFPAGCSLSPIVKSGFHLGSQIEAANILSGGVDIFGDENSCDGNELVIDDNVVDSDEKSNHEPKPCKESEVAPKVSLVESESVGKAKDTEVVLQIDGKHVDAIDIGNGMYLYRLDSEHEELAAVQILQSDQQPPSYKFLKVRENAEGNLEVYEEIEVEVPKEVLSTDENAEATSKVHAPIKDIISKVHDAVPKSGDKKVSLPVMETPPSACKIEQNSPEKETKLSIDKNELNINGKTMKINEARKSPIIGSFTPMAYHSTPNKEGVPLTKTMVDMQLHPNRQNDNVKKTIEVNTECSRQKILDIFTKCELDVEKVVEASVVTKDVTNVKDVSVADKEKPLVEDKIKNIAAPMDEKKTLISVDSESKTGSLELSDRVPNIEVTPPEAKYDNSSNDALSSDKLAPKVPIAEKEAVPDNTANDNSTQIDEVSTSANGPIELVTSNCNLTPKICDISQTETVTQHESDESLSTKTNAPIKEALASYDKDSMLNIQDEEKVVAQSLASHDKESATSMLNIQGEEKVVVEKSMASHDNDSTTSMLNIQDEEKVVVAQSLDSHDKDSATSMLNIQDEEKVVVGKTLASHDKYSTTSMLNIQDEETVVENNPEVLPNAEPVSHPTKVDKESAYKVVVEETSTAKKEIDHTVSDVEADLDSDEPQLMIEEDPVPVENKSNSSSELIHLGDLGVETVKNKSMEMPPDDVIPTETVIDKKYIYKTPNEPVEQSKTSDVKCIESKIPTTIKLPTVTKTNIIPTIKPERKSDATIERPKPEVDKDFVDKIVNKALFINKGLIVSDESKKTDQNETQTMNTDSKTNVLKLAPLETKPKPVNNAVPFGKWTQANKQAYLNRIKETKVTSTNTNQIKHSKDLNSRDVLKKMDVQRQNNIIAAKNQEANSKPTAADPPAFMNKNSLTATKIESKIPVKAETQEVKKPNATKETPLVQKDAPLVPKETPFVPKDTPLVPKTDFGTSKTSVTNTKASSVTNVKTTVAGSKATVATVKSSSSDKEVKTSSVKPPRPDVKELIDRTIEDMIKESRPRPRFIQELESNQGPSFFSQTKSLLDDIETKMNIFHDGSDAEGGTNPEEKTPSVYKNKPSVKHLTSKAKSSVPDDISEEDIIEHEPITGDLELSSVKPSPAASKETPDKKDAVITENDFDKFARRTSVTYENCLKVNYDGAKPQKVVQTVVETDSPQNSVGVKPQLSPALAKSPIQDSQSKTSPSKFQIAYNSALTKRYKESPVIIEDKPVQVVFMDARPDFSNVTLNVLGRDLSPAKKTLEVPEVPAGPSPEIDVTTVSEAKRDDIKKIRHQRKQVLTPVEQPELEIVEPTHSPDSTPKKRRKIEEPKPIDKVKPIIPKKSYLLSRASEAMSVSTHSAPKETVHSAASAIDSLVKAAELLETQSNTSHSANTSVENLSTTPTPQKRGRGRPRKYPLPEGANTPDKPSPSPQKKARVERKKSLTSSDDSSSDEALIRENWTMGKINENIVCPICNKLFRSENVVFKHVKHCSGPSPTRSEPERPARRSRRSRAYDEANDSTDSEDDDDDDTEFKRKMEVRRAATPTEVIVIEDTPLKEKTRPKEVKSSKPKPTLPVPIGNLTCEFCGKSFRQLSYLVSHKLQHKSQPKKTETQDSKSVFGCDVCKKQFRKLHHLVQHRVIHEPSGVSAKFRRKRSAEEPKSAEPTKGEDQSAAFRCEPCDKSFRKLHHLVEHRETHEGAKQKPEAEKREPEPEVRSKKPARKSDASDSKVQDDSEAVKGPVSSSTRDIIHECSLCYMVFPNEHSLTKHTVNCQKKKRQKAAKREDDDQSQESAEDADDVVEIVTPEPTPELTEAVKPAEVTVGEVAKETETTAPAQLKVIEINDNASPPPVEPKATQEVAPKVEQGSKEKEATDDAAKATPTKRRSVTRDKPVAAKKHKPTSSNDVTDMKKPNTVTSDVALKPVSEDEEVRYMLNPDFKEEAESKAFMRVRANKRSSLQIERPNSKDLVQRRTSLQLALKEHKKNKMDKAELAKSAVKPKLEKTEPKSTVKPKVDKTRAKVERLDVKKPVRKVEIAKLEQQTSTSDSDSDVKYSFPKDTEKAKVIKEASAGERRPERKSVVDRRKTLSSIAKRKSLGKTATPKLKAPAVKKPPPTHRCDCGQLFTSAALLSRHAALAHTPPRRPRRPAAPAAPPASAARGSTGASRKSTNSTEEKAKDKTPKPAAAKPSAARPSVTKPPVAKPSEAKPSVTKPSVAKPLQAKPPVAKPSEAKPSASKPTRRGAHRGVPVPEKMRRLMEKLNK